MQQAQKPGSTDTSTAANAPGYTGSNMQNRHTCICCRVKFESSELQRSHFKTEWHSYNLKRKVCNLDPIDSDGFDQIKASSQILRKDIPTVSDKSEDLEDATSDEDWERIDESEFVDEDYTEDEIEDLLARMVKKETCFFCDHKSTNMQRNIDHMGDVHGFFIPEDRYVIDLEGMMAYLGFKVGAAATCLWCGKQFTTLHGVRLHMLYKDHCKIQYDQENAVEFKEYYDYTDQEQITMRPHSELVLSTKKAKRHQQVMLLRRQRLNNSRELVSKKPAVVAGSYQSKNIKRFTSQRAKRLLHISMQNNYAMRGRLRNQNPL